MQSLSLEQSVVMAVAVQEASSPQRGLYSNSGVTHGRQSSSGHGDSHTHSQHYGHKLSPGSQAHHGNHDGHCLQESGDSRSLRRQMRQLEIASSISLPQTTESSLEGPLPMDFDGVAATTIKPPNDTAALMNRKPQRIDSLQSNDIDNHHRQSKPSRRRSRMDRFWKKEPLPSLSLSLPLPGQAHLQLHHRHHRHRQAKPLDYRDDDLSGSRPSAGHYLQRTRDGVFSEERGRAIAGIRKMDTSFGQEANPIGQPVGDRTHHRNRHHQHRRRRSGPMARHSHIEEHSECNHQAGLRTSADRCYNQGAESTQVYRGDSASAFCTSSSPTMSRLIALILESTRVMWTGASQVTKLVLSESILGGADVHDQAQLLMAVRKIPRLTHFAANTRVAILVPGLLETLLEFHNPHLISFQLVDYPLQSATVTRQEDAYHLNGWTSPPLFEQEQYCQQLPSHPIQGQRHGSDSTATPETQQRDVQEQPTETMPRICCRLLECCPQLQLFESSVPLPLVDLIASVPRWASASILTALRIEIQEFSGAGALDIEEEMVMQMFVKSLFMGNWSTQSLGVSKQETRLDSSSGSGSDSGMSDVGSRSTSPWTLHQRIPAIADGPALPFSTASTDSGGGSSSSCNRGFSDRASWAMSMPGSTSGSPGVFSDLASSSSSSQQEGSPLYSTRPAQLHAPSLMKTQTGEGPGLSQNPCALPGTISLHPQNDYFATGASANVPPPAVQENKESFVGVANLSNVANKMTNSRGAIYHSLELMDGLTTPILPAPPPSPMSVAHSYPVSSGLHRSSPMSHSAATPQVWGFSLEGLKTRPAAGMNNGHSPIDSVDRLVALQFLVEHQLVYLPKLDRFFLGNRLYKIPTRR